MAKTEESYRVSSGLQKLFIGLTIISLLAPLAFQMYILRDQLQYAYNLKGLLLVVFKQTILPLLLFLVAYFIKPRKIPTLPRIFESSMLMSLGIIMMSVLNYITIFVIQFVAEPGDDVWKPIFNELIALNVLLFIYIVVVYRWRSTAK